MVAWVCDWDCVALLLGWTASIGLMHHRKIQVRTQCRRCGPI